MLTAGEPSADEGRPRAVGTTCTGIAGGFDIAGGADVAKGSQLETAATGLQQSKPPTPSWAVAAAQSETLPPI